LLQADDVIGEIAQKLQPGFLTNLDDFLATIDKEQSFTPYGQLLSTYTVNSGTVMSQVKILGVFPVMCYCLGHSSERHFEMYSCTIDEPGFRSYHERLQTFLLWYVDAASFIDVDDDHWRYYLV